MVADETYLRRALLEPQSDVVEGVVVPMPRLPLDDAEVDLLVAYIRSLVADG